MIITYLGVESLKIQFGDTVIAYNPVSKDSKFKSTRYGADIVLVSANNPDFNGVEQATRGDKAPFVINGPGEYEIGGIFIRGFQTKTKYGPPAMPAHAGQAGGDESLNTIYLLNLENMNLCFLGSLDSGGSMDAETTEALDDIDVLFVPIGGNGVLTPAEANKVAVSLEPKIIIPIHFGEDISTTALKAFLKEGGEEVVKPEDKLTIKKKDLEGKEGDIIVLAPSAS